MATTTGKLLNIDEVAERCHKNKRSVYRLIRDVGFPQPIKVGLRSSRWLQDEVEAWLASRPRGGSGVEE